MTLIEMTVLCLQQQAVLLSVLQMIQAHFCVRAKSMLKFMQADTAMR